MELRQRVRLDVLRPGAWTPETFSPVPFQRLASTPDPADVARTDVDRTAAGENHSAS